MNYLLLSLTLLGLGFSGLLVKRSLLKILISIEILATAAAMNFVLLSSLTGRALGETLLVLAFSTDACISAVILSLFVIVSKKYGKKDISELADMEEETGEGKVDSEAEP
ncbi:MAG: NADH-quinone oxidoreductase subunit K [Candidatus Bathyarchaeia archaeon]